jgi:hypothetical protein
MTLLEAIRNEERKLAKEVSKVQGKLNGIRAAVKAFSGSGGRDSNSLPPKSRI